MELNIQQKSQILPQDLGLRDESQENKTMQKVGRWGAETDYTKPLSHNIKVNNMCLLKRNGRIRTLDRDGINDTQCLTKVIYPENLLGY